MTPLIYVACLTAGGFAFSLAWFVMGATAGSAGATARLSRLGNEGGPSGPAQGLGGGLRKRAGQLSFGGLNVVPANMVAGWSGQLERGGLAINVREYFILRVAVALGLAAVSLLTIPFPYAAPVAALLGFGLPGFWLKRRVSKRTRKLEAQLIEMLQMLSSGLRAGFGLMQAMETSSEQLPAPLSVEVRRTLRDTAMGASIEQALNALNARVGSADFDIVITAILIQRNVGGNLAEILDNVAHTMRERERIRGEINTLTSQQRLTGYVVGGIPVGLAGVFYLINPAFISLLFTDRLGNMMIGAAAIMEVCGFFVIRKIVDIEV